jgi:hypothetical protein
MNRSNLSQKVKILEKDISEIKKYLGFGIPKEEINFDIDLENWQKVKRTVKKVREELFKERYPRLYAKLKKSR